jgi:hypothetical protein
VVLVSQRPLPFTGCGSRLCADASEGDAVAQTPMARTRATEAGRNAGRHAGVDEEPARVSLIRAWTHYRAGLRKFLAGRGEQHNRSGSYQTAAPPRIDAKDHFRTKCIATMPLLDHLVGAGGSGCFRSSRSSREIGNHISRWKRLGDDAVSRSNRNDRLHEGRVEPLAIDHAMALETAHVFRREA